MSATSCDPKGPRKVTLPILRMVVIALPLALLAGFFLFWTGEEQPYRRIRPAQLAEELAEVFEDARSAEMHYWQSKPGLVATFAYPRTPKLSDSDREAVRRMKAGEFRANRLFAWKPLGVPPPWSENPFDSNTYDFYLHSLRWLEPLADSWVCEGDVASLDLMKRVMEDWIRTNSTPPGASSSAWADHATSYRMRIYCWFWELWRTTDTYDPEFARLLLASIYQHGVYLADDTHHDAASNHSPHMDGSLLAAVATFPEFKAANHWREVAEQRLTRYVDVNFDSQGFNLEQSPYYHWYALQLLGQVVEFLRVNNQTIPSNVQGVLNNGLSVWPWLIRPDGTVPNVGDSNDRASTGWRTRARRFLGHTPPEPAPSTWANPRDDGSSFLISPGAGYAIFTSYPVGDDRAKGGTYVLFRCNSWFHSNHCHRDALSFELFGLGREWLVDSGKLNYKEETADRKYMTSSRAHNVVLVDGQDFPFRPVELVDSGRTPDGDFVAVRHHLAEARHVRRLTFCPPQSLRLTDELESTDGGEHTFAQLFHVAPGLRVEIVSPSSVRLWSKEGAHCMIEQVGDPGEWSVITGQRDPFIQGWYSRRFDEMQPNPVLYFTTPRPVQSCKFVTQITLRAQ